ncbi:hypothetical protein [Levilactobacillus tujiorum]|uniref:Uncharacterized protein n=1 Tax=Levilactobacillus tujiorum TaxID=2912243 RepID=A0ABX1L6A6_9LACO|nr:hypothetical protein [Levilactobacillus tujiorum]MCH5465596.1 hypothetical protein [Levilactobacillus tujiorum]NLR12679.1 hypothetical protein [Lactobacillus sp. HBUAS51387]NLR30601.1 hypothetical protein [Levilactobacillus tujiorum]
MKKKIRGLCGLLIGIIVGLLLFAQPPRNQSTITDSVVKPTSGQTAVQVTNTTGRGHVEIKTQTTTSQEGKTVSRQTTTTSPVRQQQSRPHR